MISPNEQILYNIMLSGSTAAFVLCLANICDPSMLNFILSVLLGETKLDFICLVTSHRRKGK